MPVPHRIMLVPEVRTTGALALDSAPKIKRYRLARARLAEGRDRVAPQHEHLRRVHD